ncbi:hypothetical protein [Micromonospora sp. NPDC005206]|uniref:hypothetical protein n=1 Tax=Micromonospora sp. NPDC005206 TaxID=3157022 RepID=UPI0033A9C363
MTPEQVLAFIGGGSVAGIVIDRLVTWVLGRRKERTTLADYETQIAERLLGRMDAQLSGAETKLHLAETQMAAANLTIAGLREELAQAKAEVAHLRTEVQARKNVAAERDQLLIQNAQLKAKIQTLGGTP